MTNTSYFLMAGASGNLDQSRVYDAIKNIGGTVTKYGPGWVIKGVTQDFLTVKNALSAIGAEGVLLFPVSANQANTLLPNDLVEIIGTGHSAAAA